MKYISFGNISVYLIYPFLTPIFRVINTNTVRMFKNDPLVHVPIISLCLMFFGEIIGGCLYFYHFFRLGKATKHNLQETTIIFSRISIKNVKYSFRTTLYIFCFAVFDLIASIFANSVTTAEFNYLMRSLQLFLYAILCVMILKYKVYCHKYMSMAIIAIGVVIVNIVFDYSTIEWYWIILSFLSLLLYAFKYTGEKWLMLNRHFNPMLILLLEGVFGLVLSLLILLGIYIYCLSCKYHSVCSNLNPFDSFGIIETFGFIIRIIISALLNVCLFQTNYYFMPTLLVVSDVLSSFLDWVVKTIISKHLITLALVGYIIILLGALVYNEIIILHFCALDYYTKTMIAIRSKSETSLCDKELLNLVIEEGDINDDMEGYN